MLDAIYYSFISLSTIGFGDFIPSMEPPNKYAEYVRNDTAWHGSLLSRWEMILRHNFLTIFFMKSKWPARSFEALINPIPTEQDDQNDDGLSKLCNPSIWPEHIEIIFNMYRVMVFFWILCGLGNQTSDLSEIKIFLLVWLGGVISIMTEMIRHRGKSLDDEKQKNEENEEKKDKNLRQQSTKRLNNGSLQKVSKRICQRSRKFYRWWKSNENALFLVYL